MDFDPYSETTFEDPSIIMMDPPEHERMRKLVIVSEILGAPVAFHQYVVDLVADRRRLPAAAMIGLLIEAEEACGHLVRTRHPLQHRGAPRPAGGPSPRVCRRWPDLQVHLDRIREVPMVNGAGPASVPVST